MVRAVLFLVAVIGAAGLIHEVEAVSLEKGSPAPSRVRATDIRIERLIAEGCRRSRTFAMLLEEFQSSNWIVFVQPGSCQIDGLVGCLLHRVGTYEDAKYLRIVLTSTSRSDAEDIATLGHELQHAVEVVRDGGVAHGSDIRDLYRRIGYVVKGVRGGEIYETRAAVQTGAAVLRQLGAVQTTRLNESRGCAVESILCPSSLSDDLRTWSGSPLTTPDVERMTSRRVGNLARSCSIRE